MNRFLPLAFILIAFLGTPVYGQEALTLEQCRSLAVENSRDIKNKKLDFDISEQSSKQAFTKYFPQIQASGMYVNSRKPFMEIPFFNPITSTLMPISLLKEGKAASLTLVQPLFQGGQIYNGNKLARIGEKASEIKVSISREEVEEKCDQYFWQYIQLSENLKTIKSMEELLGAVKHDVNMAIKAGMRTRNDLLRVEMQEQELESAKLKLNNGMATTMLLLKQLIGASDSITLVAPDIENFHSPDEVMVNSLETAQNRPEAQLLDASLTASELQRKMELGKLLPSAALGAGLIYHDVMGNNFNTAVLSINVSVPITAWWEGSHSLKKKKLEAEQIRNQKQDAIEMLAIKIDRAFMDTQEAYEQIKVQSKSVTSAQENMRTNRNAYQNGTITMSDLMEAQNLLIQNNYNLTQAFTDYQLKLASYLRLVQNPQ